MKFVDNEFPRCQVMLDDSLFSVMQHRCNGGQNYYAFKKGEAHYVCGKHTKRLKSEGFTVCGVERAILCAV